MINIDNEIEKDIDLLRTKFPNTKDLYREVCIILFFRYGINPTVNKLYQYVRKGSMSAPAEALNSFWNELRNKSSIQLDHPGVPENLKNTAGEILSTFWNAALESAQATTKVLNSEIEEKLATIIIINESLNEKLVNLDASYQLQSNELKNCKEMLSTSENKLLVEAQISAGLRESLETLKNANKALEAHLADTQLKLTDQIDKLHSSLNIAETRFRALEAKSLLDVDRERQKCSKLESDFHNVTKLLNKERSDISTKISKHNSMVNSLRENLGVIKGQLKESQRQQLVLSNRIKQLERIKPTHKGNSAN